LEYLDQFMVMAARVVVDASFETAAKSTIGWLPLTRMRKSGRLAKKKSGRRLDEACSAYQT
jgi:hypothetical protein